MKKMTKAMLMTALICGTMYCGAEPVQASEINTFALDEYVVTATRTPVELFNANANISVITKEQIENRHYQNLEEVLYDVPGVIMNNYGSPGYATSSGLRINGSKKILFMIDGVRMNQGSEANLLELVTDLGNVERVEVLHGSASSLYGADAQGGVVNIITNSKPANLTKAFIEGGSFDKLRMGLSTQGNEKGWSYRLSGTKSKIGDFKDGAGKEVKQSDDAKTFSAMISKELGENGDKGDITFTYDRYKTDFEYTNMHTGNPNKDGTIANGNYETESYRMVFNYNFDDTLANRFTISRNERLLLEGYGTLYNIETIGVTEQLTKQFGSKNTLTGGIDYYKDKFISGYDALYNGDWSQIDGGMNDESLKNIAFYIQDIHEFTDKLNITLGARYDDNNIYDGELTGNAKVGYKFTNDTNMYISYGTFFNTPSAAHLWHSEYGNSSLKPETGNTIELGINHKFDDSFNVSTHIFKREMEDAIDWDYKNERYYNIDVDEEAKGFDVQLNKRFDENWNLNVAYTYIKEDRGGSGENNNGQIPKHTVNIGVGYDLNKFNASLVAKGIIDRPGISQSLGKFYPQGDTYWLVDLGLNYKADKNHKFYFKVNNLFDKLYAENSNVNPAWGGAAEQWWTMPGRSFIVGMEYSF